MVFTVKSFAVIGIDAHLVTVQIDAARGLPGMVIVGLPSSSVKESRERVKSAITNSGYPFPVKKIIVNLAPADLKKDGTLYDLPIALGILGSSNILNKEKLNDYVIAGELGLKGEVRSIRGVLPAAIFARRKHYKGLIVPLKNAEEASLIKGIDIIPVKSLTDTISFLNNDKNIEPFESKAKLESPNYSIDMNDIVGQYQAKRALEIAAAGGHNVFMVGPPGSGKTMLARRLPSILPPMTESEIIETTRIYSVAGILDGIITRRPFRSPHSSVSDVALIGGGSNVKPGEVSLAHNGVLFLDEVPEFKRSALESLRQPMEDGLVTISRASGSITFPSEFSLVAAANPCPCGYYGFEDGVHTCTCTQYQVRKYQSKMSGPILDRIDIHISVPAVKPEDISRYSRGESSSTIRNRVVKAHEMQRKRFAKSKEKFNSRMTSRQIKKFCQMTEKAEDLLNTALKTFALSARAYNRILKISRTIADIDGSDTILEKHVIEAVNFRNDISTGS